MKKQNKEIALWALFLGVIMGLVCAVPDGSPGMHSEPVYRLHGHAYTAALIVPPCQKGDAR